MKPRDIQRGISSRNVRTGGEAPGIGKVSRVRRGTGNSSGGGRRRRGARAETDRRKSIHLSSVVLGVVALAIIGTAVFFWMKALQERESDVVRTTAVIDTIQQARSKFPSPSEEEALALVKRAVANRDPAKVPALFRAGAASPDEIVAYFEEAGPKDGPPEKYRWLSSMDSDDMLIEGVLVSFKSEEKKRERLALLTPDEKGNWRLDFESYSRRMDATWSDLLAKKADHARVRVMVAADPYYNGIFSDEKKWICYAMASPDTDELLRGYCLIGSPEAERMAGIITPIGRDGLRTTQTSTGSGPAQKTSRAILDIRCPEGAESKQFQITRVIAREWLLPDGAPESK